MSRGSCSAFTLVSERWGLNIARIANAVHCHNLLSDYKDCHEFRFSIVRIVISVTNPRIVCLYCCCCLQNLNIFGNSGNLPKVWLIKCLKSHKSGRSVVKTLIVSWVRHTDRQRSPIELFWTAKNIRLTGRDLSGF